MSVFRKVQLGAVLLLAVGFAVLLQVPNWVDARMNSLIHRPPYPASVEGSALHITLLAMARRPVLVSHTGVEGTCPGPCNLTDDHLQRIAATGGVVGIGYWEGAVCDASLAGVVKAIRYAVGKVGVAHVALGSDFDGATRMPFDATGLPALTDALRKAGFSVGDVRAIMGGNVQRLLLQSLPSIRPIE